jgi:hypothetical protein
MGGRGRAARAEDAAARGAGRAARAKTPDLVRQEFWGLLLAAFPPRDRLALHDEVLDEILEERVASSRGRQVPRGAKRQHVARR